jgi:hypothetical protein
VHPVCRCRHNGDALVKGIDDFENAPANLLHEPGHVEGGNIRSAGGGDYDFPGGIHFGLISVLQKPVSMTENNNEWFIFL